RPTAKHAARAAQHHAAYGAVACHRPCRFVQIVCGHHIQRVESLTAIDGDNAHPAVLGCTNVLHGTPPQHIATHGYRRLASPPLLEPTPTIPAPQPVGGGRADPREGAPPGRDTSRAACTHEGKLLRLAPWGVRQQT